MMLKNLILIRPIAPKEISSGGVYIPPKMESEGTVIDCGPQCESVKKGQTVCWLNGDGDYLEIDGEELLMITETDIIYIKNEHA